MATKAIGVGYAILALYGVTAVALNFTPAPCGSDIELIRQVFNTVTATGFVYFTGKAAYREFKPIVVNALREVTTPLLAAEAK